MRTEAQKRVCEAFERLVSATVVRDMAVVRGKPLSVALMTSHEVLVSESDFLTALNAVIDERKGVQS